jgi:hypothetical protein
MIHTHVVNSCGAELHRPISECHGGSVPTLIWCVASHALHCSLVTSGLPVGLSVSLASVRPVLLVFVTSCRWMPLIVLHCPQTVMDITHTHTHTKHHAMKTYWGSRGIALRIMNLDTRWRWVVSFTPRPLYSRGKSPWNPLDSRLGGPQNRCERDDEEKKIPAIAQWYSAGLRAGRSGVRIPAGNGYFSLHHRCVQTGSGAHRASYPMGTRDSFPGGKAAWTWSWPFISI